MRYVVQLVLITAVLSLSSVASAEDSISAQQSLHSTYVGERGGYAINRIEIPSSSTTIETLSSDSGATLLIVSNKATGRSQSFVLPQPTSARSGDFTTQALGEIELIPIILRSDGSGVYEVRRNDDFIGFMTVSSAGVWNFIPVNTQPK